MHRRVVRDDHAAPASAEARSARRPDASAGSGARDLTPLGRMGRLAIPRDDALSSRLSAAVAARTLGRAVIDTPAAAPRERLLQRSPESEALLTKLSIPTVKPPPALEVQQALVKKLDIDHQNEFYGGIINLGGILIDELPEGASDDDVIAAAQLTALPRARLGDPYRYVSAGSPKAAKVKELGLDRLVIDNVLTTMKDAEQFKYLRLAGLPNKDWKILVEVHYFRERDMSATGFHKDTLGQTLFVNLNYHMGEQLKPGEKVIGPEIIVNPPRSPEHHQQVKQTLPGEFRKDLKAARGKLGDPDEIKTELVDPYGYVAFVDEAVHHATPLYGHRYVTPVELTAYLTQAYPEESKEAQRAYDEYLGRDWKAWIWPYSSYVDKSIINATDIPKWQKCVELLAGTDRKTGRLTRHDLAPMPSAEFDKVLTFAGKNKLDGGRASGRAAGFHTAAIPGAKGFSASGDSVGGHEYPVAPEGKVLKRTLSNAKFRATLPSEPAAHVKRRFFRTWVRAIPKAMADELPRRLAEDARKDREAKVAAEERARAAAEAQANAGVDTGATAQLQSTSS